MAGKPVIKGTRVPIDLILKMLSQDISIDEIIAEYPRLCKEYIQAALLYGSIVDSYVFRISILVCVLAIPHSSG